MRPLSYPAVFTNSTTRTGCRQPERGPACPLGARGARLAVVTLTPAAQRDGGISEEESLAGG